MKGEVAEGLRLPGAGRRAAMIALAVSSAVVVAGVVLAAIDSGDGTRIVTAPETAGTPEVPVGAVELPEGTPPSILALAPETGKVTLLDPASGDEVRVLATHPPDESGSLQGAALTPDGRYAYYSVAGDCGDGSIYQVRTEGRSQSRWVGGGISPAVSPDGRRLAYAAPGPQRADGTGGCHNLVVIRDLISGEEVRRIGFPDDETHQSSFHLDAAFTRLSWAPDSRRLAITHSYEGDSVSVLDTEHDTDLSQTVEVVVPDGGGDSRHPAWQASSGRLAVVNSAFACCFDDHYTGPPRTLLVDVENRRTFQLLPEGLAPDWLDFDLSGEHLLYVDGGSLYRRSQGGAPALVAPGFTIADW